MISYFYSNAKRAPSDTCYNCMKSNGDEETDKLNPNPSGSVKLSRCSKCKLAIYCSALCKKEHWYTTHSKHCKYLSGEEKKDGDHDERKCRTCRDMVRKPQRYSGEAGTLVVCPFKSNKAHSICKDVVKMMASQLVHHLQNVWDFGYRGDEDVGTNLQINLPFELGELTGNYVDEVDRTLGDMTTLAATIDLKHCEVQNWLIVSEIMKTRTFYWSCLLSRHEEFFYNWFTNFNPLWVSLHQINNFIQQQKKEKGKYNPTLESLNVKIQLYSSSGCCLYTKVHA